MVLDPFTCSWTLGLFPGHALCAIIYTRLKDLFEIVIEISAYETGAKKWNGWDMG